MGGKNLEGRQTMRSPAPGTLVWWDGRRLFGQQPGRVRGEHGRGPGATPGTWLSAGCPLVAVAPLQGSILLSGRNGAAREPASTRQRPPGREGTNWDHWKERPSLWTPDEPGWALRVVVGRSGTLWAPVGLLSAALNGPIGPPAPCLPRFVDLWMAYGIVLSTGCCSSFLPVRLSLFFCPLLLRRPPLSLVIAANDAALPGCTRFPALTSERGERGLPQPQWQSCKATS